jgi:FkbM family methyltransferase
VNAIDAIFSGERPIRKKIDSSILIYGAGNNGITVANHLLENGIQILGFIDKNAESLGLVNGIPVYTIQQVQRRFPPNQQILVAIHNYMVDISELILSIKTQGFNNVINMFDYVRLFPNDQTYRYFLSSPEILYDAQSEISQFYEHLEDLESQNILEAIVHARYIGDYDLFPTPTQDQYFPLDIPKWDSQLRFIDCGAYDGDTIRALIESGYSMDALIALEPDQQNYLKLIDKCSSIEGIYLPNGVSDQFKEVYFNQSQGASSRELDIGETKISMLSIDQAFKDWAPNLIKMDIEGGEIKALEGAENTIKKYQPSLAISVYHHPNDLWRIGQLIKSFSQDYKMYLRSHSYSSFDTVLYAMT